MATPFPAAHVFPHTAQVNDAGHLSVGGCDVVDLVAEYDSPLYLFDEETLRERCRAYRQAFEGPYPRSRLLYACKAFTNPALVRLLHQEGYGLDVVSGGEMAVAQAGGMPPEGVYFHGNNKSLAELREALRWGIGRVVLDNFHEIDLLEQAAREADRPQEVLLRVSPGVDAHTHTYTTTGTLDSKFGFPLETGQAVTAVRRVRSSPYLRLLGLHFHLGSPIFEVEPYGEALRLTLAFAARMREEGLELQEVSPGGGFAIAYTRDQRAPQPSEYAQVILSTLRSQCQALELGEPALVIEPGRAIVGPAGVALYTVGGHKSIPHLRTYVSLDGGMGDNIRPALYNASYEAVAAGRVNEEATDQVTLAGRFCESGDILVKDATLPPVQPGDVIAVPAAGAYALAMASNYNLAPRPAIVLVRDGTSHLIRRRETYQDMMAADVF